MCTVASLRVRQLKGSAGRGARSGASRSVKKLLRLPGSFWKGRSLSAVSCSPMATLKSARPKKLRFHCGAVVGGQLLVGRGDLGLVAVGFRDAGSEIVRHKQLRGAPEELEGVHVSREEALHALVLEDLGVGVVAGPEHGQEE